jgi:hypothetical protein
MLRVRFRANAADPRPINWPVRHPYWCTGYGEEDGKDFAIVVSYADDVAYIRENWPEAKAVESEQVGGYTFTSRFPKPDWFTEPT